MGKPVTKPPKPSREEIALQEVGVTAIAPGTARLLIVVFALLIGSVPLYDAVGQVRAGRPVAALDLLAHPPELSQFTPPVHHRAEMERNPFHDYESVVENASLLRSAVQRDGQAVFSRLLGMGNSKVVLGRDGWLFYRPGLDYLAAPDFRSDAWNHRHPRLHRDALAAISSLQADCIRAGVRLVLMPVPDKAQIAPEFVCARAAGTLPDNPGYAPFRAELDQAGIEVFDPAPLMRAMHRRSPAFLRQDTHWTPAVMEAVADALARHLRAGGYAGGGHPWQASASSAARVGDLVDTLLLPPDQTLYAAEEVCITTVADAGGQPWRPDRDADLVLLGDSFCNIYTDPRMGWGEGAGLAPQLALRLGTGVDAITINGQAASGVREELARRSLTGKRVVVWQFPVRDLAIESWRPVAVGGQRVAAVTGYFVPEPGRSATVDGVVLAAAKAPVPGSVPYKDHVIGALIGGLAGAPGVAGKRALVRTMIMRDKVLTEAAHWRPGQRVRLVLRDYDDVAETYDPLNRQALDDPASRDAPECWAEPVP